MLNKNTQKLIMLTNTNISKKLLFNMDLYKVMLSENIPLNKLSNKDFKNFFWRPILKNITTRGNIAKKLHR